MQTEKREVELATLAGEVITEFAGPARSRGLHLIATGTAQVVATEVDPAAVRTAVGNFMGNAVRLAPRGSTIALDWGNAAGWGWIAVGDEGPGLPAELHARAFERGWQGRHDRDRATAGRGGLGLTIARQLTEAQGGLVTIDSEEGGGSVFALWLPDLNQRSSNWVSKVNGDPISGEEFNRAYRNHLEFMRQLFKQSMN